MPAKNRRLLLKTAAGNPLFQPISAESTEFTPDSGMTANKCSALDARTALCLHIEDHWPGASESERSMV